MRTEEITALQIGCRVDSLRKHLKLAKGRENSEYFVGRLRLALAKQVETLNVLTSVKRLAVTTALLCAIAVSGCGTVHGIGSDLQGGSKAGAEWFRTYGEDFEQQYYPAPRMIN